MNDKVGVAQKKKPSNPIKFHVQLNEEQKKAKSVILDNKIIMIRGAAGSGKSLLAAQVGLDLLFTKQIEKIILTRPVVTAGEDIGFLPGDKDQKLAPYTAAVYDNMYRLYNKEKIDKEIAEGRIEVIPIGFIRGRNFTNACVIADEGQNITHSQFELLISRICHGTKVIICGDSAQIDLKDKKMSGFDFAYKHLKDIPGFDAISLKTNHRDPIVEDILRVYNDYRS